MASATATKGGCAPRREVRRNARRHPGTHARAAASTSTERDQQEQKSQRDAEQATAMLLDYLRTAKVQAARYVSMGTDAAQGRGLYAAEDIEEGAVLAVVPFDACLHAPVKGDEQKDGVLANSFWGMRLAAAIVREHLRGEESPYCGYLACLPALPPLPVAPSSPFVDVDVDDDGEELRTPREVDASGLVPHPMSFSWEDVKEIQYNEGRLNVDEWGYLSAQSFLRATEDDEALRSTFGDGADGPTPFVPRALWDWAVSCVHSRTFGAELLGEGEPMDHYMVPLLDLLNHRGDESTCETDADLVEAATTLASTSPSSWTADALISAVAQHDVATLPRGPPYVAADNVEWIADSGGARFVCVTKRELATGEQLCVSYGERSNDDFFLYYAFVPPRNPHDDVVLFDHVDACLEWCANVYFKETSVELRDGEQPSPDALADIEARAAAARRAFDAAAIAARGGRDADSGGLEAARVDREPRLKVLAGMRFDARMLSAIARFFSPPDDDGDGKGGGQLADGAVEAAQMRARARCEEVLLSYPTSLADDLERLLRSELAVCLSMDADGSWDATVGVSAAAGVLETIRLLGVSPTPPELDDVRARIVRALAETQADADSNALTGSERLTLEYRVEKKLVLAQSQ